MELGGIAFSSQPQRPENLVLSN